MGNVHLLRLFVILLPLHTQLVYNRFRLVFSDSSSVMRFWREATEGSSVTSTVALIQFVCLDRKQYHRLPVSLKREQLSIRADHSNSNGKGKSKTALIDLRNMTFPALLRTIHSFQLLWQLYLSCSIVF